MYTPSTLYLIGAGPGNPDLITLKAVKILQQASVVLYDALIDEDVLSHVSEDAVKVFVGKRAGVCQTPQEKINDLIVEYGKKYPSVVRLKGGDPFIFGRGYEEMDTAKKHGMQVEVVPGVSSFYSVPGMQHVPITRRGVNESFWVVTGTTMDHGLSNDVRLAAQSNATVVILMGMRKLPEIVSIYQSIGKGELPIGIIQNGSLKNEKVAIGTVDTIKDEVIRKGMGSPAIIVLGEVVRLHPNFQDVISDLMKNSKIDEKNSSNAFEKLN